VRAAILTKDTNLPLETLNFLFGPIHTSYIIPVYGKSSSYNHGYRDNPCSF